METNNQNTGSDLFQFSDKLIFTKRPIPHSVHTRCTFAEERARYYYKKMASALNGGNILTCKAALKYQQARRIYIHYTNIFQRHQNLPLTK